MLQILANSPAKQGVKHLLFAAAVALCAALPAHAADAPADPAAAPAAAPAKPLTAQQQKMKDCNATAKTRTLSGDARKAFMKACLSKNGSPAAAASGATPATPAAKATPAAAAAPVTPAAATTTAAPSPQQQKMKDCNKQAAAQNLKGDARKTFLGTCLKG